MTHRKWIQLPLGLLSAGAGGVTVALTRSQAIASQADAGSKVIFSLGLILVVLGAVVFIAGLLPPKKTANIRTLTMAAMFAALCYVGFAFFQIKIEMRVQMCYNK